MEDNIKTDLGQIEYDDVDWTHLPQDRVQWEALVSMIMNLWVPYKAGNIKLAEQLLILTKGPAPWS
jgi:hypothetical protein